MTSSKDTKDVSVRMTYWIGTTDNDDNVEPTQTKVFSPETTTPARIGLSVGEEPSKPQAGSYVYSGMHDHGPLVPPQEGGDMAQLLGCVQAAKQFSDDYLTQVMDDEQQQKAATAKATKEDANHSHSQ